MAASAAEASLSVDGETVKGVVLEPEMLLHAEHLLLKGLGVLLQPMAAHTMLGMRQCGAVRPRISSGPAKQVEITASIMVGMTVGQQAAVYMCMTTFNGCIHHA